MRLAWIQTDGGVVSGRYGDGVVTADGEEYEVDIDAELLALCDPTAPYCMGRNYAATVDQMDYDIFDQPDWSIKSPVSVLDLGVGIEYPDWTDELMYADELATVIDRECSDAAEEDVDEVVHDYTIPSDLDVLGQSGRTA